MRVFRPGWIAAVAGGVAANALAGAAPPGAPVAPVPHPGSAPAAATAAPTKATVTATAPETAPVPTGIAGRLIEHFHMQRVPQEGPWFSLTYASDDSLDGASLAPRYAGRTHLAGTAIVLIETAADFSAMHRLQTDEVWHFYGGSPIEMLLLYPDGHGRRLTLGPDVMAGELPQFAVPHGVWQGSRPRGTTTRTYSFAGDQLSPGFDYADFEMGYRDTLAREYPAFAQDIARLTRPEYAVRPVPVASNPPAQATPASVFAAAEVPPQRVAAGVELRELVGRVAPLARTDLLSIAQFTLAPGHGSGTSFNHRSQEVFMVLSGSGRVHLDARVVPVGPGSTVFIPAQQRHSIAADAGSSLIFFAVSAPAFAPDDYVAVPP